MIALKASAIVFAACLATMLMRGRSAAWRHAVLASGLIAAACMPLLELFAPAWGAALLRDLPATTPMTPRASFPVDLVRAIWLAGAAMTTLALVAGIVRLAWIGSRAGRDVPERWRVLVADAARAAGIDRTIALRESNAGTTPMTVGFVRPALFFPPEARRWDDDRLRDVIAHELAHVARADWLVQFLVDLVVNVFWFDPVMWIARRRLRLEAERACDDAVLNLGADRTGYATHLVDVARAMRGHSLHAAAMSGPGSLERRVAAVLNSSTNRVPLSPLGAFATALMLFGAALPIAGFGITSSDGGYGATHVLDVQREIMMRFGGEERRFSIVANDVSFWNNRIEGRVELQARLTVDGSVSGVRLVEPAHPDLASAAESIVRHWRREPARIRGVPVEVPIRMTVDFRR